MATFKRATFNPNYLFSGDSWNRDENNDLVLGQPLTITFSYLTSLPFYYSNITPRFFGQPVFPSFSGFQAFTASQEFSAQLVRDSWASYTNITWEAVTQNNATNTVGGITFGNYSLPTTPLVYEGLGFYPNFNLIDPTTSPFLGGDVWISTKGAFPSISLNPEPGNYGYYQLLHELGHALGLAHDGRTGVILTVPGTPAVRLPSDEANILFTVMANVDVNYVTSGGPFPITPMMYDIAQIQRLYGANITYNAGATTYTFTDNSHPFVAGMLSDSPYRNPGKVLMTIWDGDGITMQTPENGDTIDATGMTTKVLIDLRPGAFSAIGLDSNDGSKANVGVALGTVIENATGGSGSDYIIGNARQNTLKGNGGNDTLDGGTTADAGTGNVARGQGDGAVDTFAGGADLDRFILREGGGAANAPDIVDDDGSVNGLAETLEFRAKNDAPLPFERIGLPVAGSGGNVWRSLDGNWSFQLAGSTLDVTHNTIDAQARLLNYSDGDFGIVLLGDLVDPVTTRDILGDREPQDFDPNEPGVQTQVDDLGNVIVTDTVSPDRADQLNDSAGSDRIIAGGGDDSVNAFRGGADLIDMGAGRDSVDAREGDDVVVGGAGSDIVIGGAGNDRLYAEAQAELTAFITASGSEVGTGQKGDWLQGGSGRDLLFGSASNDVLAGGADHDLIVGGGGNDDLLGDAEMVPGSFDWSVSVVGITHVYQPISGAVNPSVGGADTIYAGAGDDFATGQGGDDVIYGEAGDDKLDGGPGSDTLFGGADNDQLVGDDDAGNVAQFGADYLDGGAGDDVLTGGGRSDALYGGAGNDQLFGDSGIDAAYHGDDYLDGGAGDDVLVGSGGSDTLFGGTENDALLGDAIDVAEQYHGNDHLDGGAGNDSLVGFGGDDTLIGGADNDLLVGGPGQDTLAGGSGLNVLEGSDGDDHYVLGAGLNEDGTPDLTATVDIVDDVSGQNTLEFTAGIEITNLATRAFVSDDGNPYLEVTNNANYSVLIRDGLLGPVSSFTFADGTTRSLGELLVDAGPLNVLGNDQANDLFGSAVADLIEGRGGDDTIAAGAGDDALDGGLGNDTLFGDAGQDQYVLTWGMGRDTAIDAEGGLIRLSTGLTVDDLYAQANGADLFVGIRHTDAGMLIKDFATGTWQVDAGDGQLVPAVNLPAAPTPGSTHQALFDRALAQARADFYTGLGAQGFSPQPDGTMRRDVIESGSGFLNVNEYHASLVVESRTLDDAEIFRQSPTFNFADLVTSSFMSRTTQGQEVARGSTGLGLAGSGGGQAYFVPIDRIHGGVFTPGGSSVVPIKVNGDLTGFWILPPGSGGGVGGGGGGTTFSYTFSESYARWQTNYVVESITAGGSDNLIHANQNFNVATIVSAGGGNDTVEGFNFPSWSQRGTDTSGAGTFMDGGDGSDRLLGSQGSDELIGGVGDDTLEGNGGADTYLVLADDAGYDVIVDDGAAPMFYGGRIGLEFYEDEFYKDAYYQSIGLPDWRLLPRESLPPVPKTNDFTAWEPFYDGKLFDGFNETIVIRPDTVEFLSGLSVSDLRLSWGRINRESTYATLNIEWGENRGLKIVVPHADDTVGAGIEYFKFADGTRLTMRELIALAPPAPDLDPQHGSGTLQDDAIEGGSAGDAIDTSDGGDFAQGLGGDDVVLGGAGDDLLRGGGVRFVEWKYPLFGEPPSPLQPPVFEQATFDSGNDVLDGGAGNDRLFGDDGNNLLVGGTGEDAMRGGGATLYAGGAGNDRVEGFESGSVMAFNLGDGQDTFAANTGQLIVSLGGGIQAGDLALSREGQDLTLRAGATDSIRFEGWYNFAPLVILQLVSGSINTYDFNQLAARFDALQAQDPQLTNWLVANELSTYLIESLTDRAFGGALAYEYATTGSFDALSTGQVMNVLRDGNFGFATQAITGIPNNPLITGTEFDDVLYGTAADDQIAGLAGNDTLDGGAGNDTYQFSLGDGIDRITDSNGTNAITFGPGITSESITLGLGSLLIRVGGSGDAIHLENFDPSDVFGPHSVENFNFADGSALSYSQLLARGFDLGGSADDDAITGTNTVDRITGFAGNDILAGGAGDDILDGGAGTDTLIGGAGNDTYRFALGSGIDLIDDASGALDAVQIGAGVTPDGVTVTRSGTTLSLGVNGTTDQLVIHWQPTLGIQIEQVQFADGTVWDAATLEAMAGAGGNVAPVVATPIADQTAPEDAAFSFQVPEGTFSDPGDALSFSATLDLGAPLPAWLAFNPTSRTFSGTPVNEDVGAFDVTVIATDSGGLSTSDSFRLTVANTNDAPQTAPDSASLSEDETVPVTGNVLANDSDVDAGTLLTVANAGTQLGNFGTLELATDGSFGYTLNGASVQSLAGGQSATDVFGYAAADGITSTPGVLTVTITGANDAPVTVEDPAAVQEDGTVIATGNVLANDSDVDAGTALIASAGIFTGTYGALSLAADGAYTYTLNNAASVVQALAAGQSASDVFTYSVSDGVVSTLGTLAISIAGTNDAPVLAQPLADLATTERQAFAFTVPESTFTDLDVADTLSFTAALASGAALPSWLTFNASTRTFSGTPGEYDIGTLAIRIAAADPSGAQAADEFNLSVTVLAGVTLTGTAGQDTLIGGPGADTISGLGGSDALYGNEGQDLIYGGDGPDQLFGWTGNDTLYGGNANDTLYGDDGHDTLYGEAGADTLWGWTGNDTLYGGGGNDTLGGDDGDDVLYGEANADTLWGGMGRDTLYGGEGNDTLGGDDGDDLLYGEGQADTIYGWTGNDYLSGGLGNDSLSGEDGTDVVQGGDNADQLYGQAGNDLLDAGVGDDALDGDGGNDFLAAGDGVDTLRPGAGQDVIAFNRGDDADTVIATGAPEDTVSVGGGIRYQELTLAKNNNDLVLDAGGGDKLIFKDWYAATPVHSVLNLQVIAEAMADFNPASPDPLLNRKVQSFDFQGLVGAFDAARAANPTLTSWALTSALLDFHLGGSDTEALGGDLAYQYGKNGALTGISLNAAQDVIGSGQFGSQAQTLRPLSSLQEGLVHLS